MRCAALPSRLVKQTPGVNQSTAGSMDLEAQKKQIFIRAALVCFEKVAKNFVAGASQF